MEKKIYGAYGSNMNLPQMAMRCPNAKVIGKGQINGYYLTFRASGVANVEVREEASVPVVLWEITDRCEMALDRFEGFPSFYVKKDIEVITETGETITAMFYVMAEKYEEYPAPPQESYLDTIIDGYKQNKIPIEPLIEALKTCRNECVELVNNEFM